ncbi:hypothetical protein [Streptomyces sp. NPDC091209]|uniref:hypothetical protein n=1 Tax=Streptomyces sp. NPDC091209 TaxID=3365974 RepID=UPI0038127D67
MPSHEVSGVLAGLGPTVGDPTVGDEVYGPTPFTQEGAAAAYGTVPARVLPAKSAGLSHTEAAAVPVVAPTAWQALVGNAALASGRHVPIHGGAGARAPSPC